MKSRLALCGLVLAVVAGMTAPAQAAPLDPTTSRRYTGAKPLDPQQLAEVTRRPASLQQDREVTALVQLSGDPVAVQQTKASPARRFDHRTAQRRVEATQDAMSPRLKAAGATVQGRLQTVLNAVRIRARVADLDEIAAVPGVRTVQVSRRVELHNAGSAQYTGVDQAWQDLKLTGLGQVIGIIDSGVDYTHADFGGPGTVTAYADNDSDVVEPGTFPTAKVTGGYDFVGDDYDLDDAVNQVPRPDADPLDCDGHGTHVAGTAGGAGVDVDGAPYTGPYDASTGGRAFAVEPGVAPQAELKAYKVFGCEGGTTSDIIAAAVDRAVADGVDVINMSLGFDFGAADDLGNVAVEAAAEAGVLVVTSAGNSGPGAYVTSSPGTADSALAVASVSAEFPSFPGAAITGAATASGILANGVALAEAITGEVVDLGLGCTRADYAAAAGKIALTRRNSACDRVVRAQYGEAAGALAVVMINTAADLPPFEAEIPGVSLPFVGVSSAAAPALAAAAGQSITISGAETVANPAYGRAAGTSSSGPRRLDNAQKPDVAAPGESIPSAGVGTGDASRRLSGTSMAAPHTAGIGALVRQAHPSWGQRETKAAIMSTASPASVEGYDSLRLGTGVVQARRAIAARTYAWTTSGLNSLRFGLNQLDGAYRESKSFKITNESSRPVTYDLGTRLSSARLGADLTVSPRTVTVRPGRTATVSLRIRLSAADVAELPGTEANDEGRLLALRGVVEATPRTERAGVGPLRMAFLSVPVALSSVTASPRVTQTVTGALPAIRVRNAGVHSGTADVYQSLLRDPAGDVGRTGPDLTDVGVQTLLPPGSDRTDRVMVFAVAQARGTSTQAVNDLALDIDTTGDSEPEFIIVGGDTGLYLNGYPDGTVSSFVYDVAAGEYIEARPASAPANGSTVLLPVQASTLGLTPDRGEFSVRATAFNFITQQVDDVEASAPFDAFFPALSQGDFLELGPGEEALVSTRVNSSRLNRQNPPGWLVVSPDDRAGRAEADRVAVELTPSSRVPAAVGLAR